MARDSPIQRCQHSESIFPKNEQGQDNGRSLQEEEARKGSRIEALDDPRIQKGTVARPAADARESARGRSEKEEKSAERRTDGASARQVEAPFAQAEQETSPQCRA
jgi:hypothetical protein